MAKGEIEYISYEPGWSQTKGYFLTGIVQFKFNSKYYLTKNSVRIYYKPLASQADADYVDVVPPDSNETGTNILKADSWQKPYTPTLQSQKSYEDISALINNAVKIVKGLSNDKYVVKFTISNLTGSTLYVTAARLRLFNSKGDYKTHVRAPENEQGNFGFSTMTSPEYYFENQPLFSVAKYSLGTNNTYTTDWEDFTDCIKLPSYDVNSEDVNEDWEDADYKTHRIAVRKKVNGKFEMIFPTMTRYKEFLNYIELSKQLNGDGIAYVELRLQVNNILDIQPMLDISQTKCVNYIGKFFIKIDNNAWIQPIFGHYDKYSPLSITIQEA